MSLADLMKKGSLRQFATVTVATVATVRPDSLPSVATVATVSVATAQKQAANNPAAVTHDPDRWAWPRTQAMTGREIDTFTARLYHFTRRGLLESDAERLADKLVTRDREWDDRRLCLECAYLSGRAGAMRCAQWQRAGLGQAGIPAGLALQLQRCRSFEDQSSMRPSC
jgi:hypothetical protein